MDRFTLSRPHAPSPAWLAIRRHQRDVVRLGFVAVIALLVLSMAEAYRIQSGYSTETDQIYRRHLKQDDLLSQLRRTVWLGASGSRDFLLNPSPSRTAIFSGLLRELTASSERLLNDLDQSMPPKTSRELRTKMREFWDLLASIPAATDGRDASERFQFVQREIVPRRNAIGDLVRDFSAIGTDSLHQNEADFSDTHHNATFRLLMILAASAAVALAVALYSMSHSEALERQVARQFEEMERTKGELRELANRLMEVQEEERTRLSRELHDEIGQTLATLRLEIARAETFSRKGSTELVERLTRARMLAERSVETVRDISLLLRPSLLDDLGLAPALDWLTEDFTRRTGVPCDLDCGALETDLEESVRTCVYRVLQESLHNCEKYAGASRVSVTLRRTADELTVAVEDDGRGFDAGSKPAVAGRVHFGLLGMRERAASLGGSFDIDSAPGKGARLTLRLPLPQAQPIAAVNGPREVHS